MPPPPGVRIAFLKAPPFQLTTSGSGRRLAAAVLALLCLWPADAADPARQADHWAFQPLKMTAPPAVHNSRWLRSPIDRFILARLEHEHLAPSPEADRPTLLRRLSLDLTGLPPTTAETDAFLTDPSPGAYERLVDRLLASPHFGERWGRHWLDLARYADSSGYQVDRERPWAWVYRDWVIGSFNRDQSFDQFTVEQLAGDLLPTPTPDQLVATGFHRMTLSNHEDGIDPAEFVAKSKVDRVATTGLVWLGLTLGCAECHSHKYDPISQREFYQTYAFFNATEERDLPLPDGRTAYTLARLTNAPKTFVHVRGDYQRHGDEVQPAFLQAVSTRVRPPEPEAASPTRLDLARWLVAPENPLTARVAVNHLWLHLFGRGLVATTEDFGLRGEPPTHPELLDWLAREFQRSGWSRKQLIRLIVTSAAYRQASHVRPELLARDPENRLLARQGRFRLESEVLRDEALNVSGLLNPRVGGKSFRPHLPDDVKWLSTAGAWSWTDDTGPDLQRRSLYIYAQRTVAHPLLPTFDQADSTQTCTRRERSDNPLQALTLLNNETFTACARALATRIAAEPPADRIRFAFRTALGREPEPQEQKRLNELTAKIHAIAPTNELTILAQTLLNLDEFLTRE